MEYRMQLPFRTDRSQHVHPELRVEIRTMGVSPFFPWGPTGNALGIQTGLVHKYNGDIGILRRPNDPWEVL